MFQADVLVLGAGPAGTATAISCAQAGLRVTLAERAAFPRHRPGETLHPGIEPLLRQLGVWDMCCAVGWLRHTGHWARQGNDTRFVTFGGDETGAWRGFQAERAHFDALLLRQAEQMGVSVVQPCRLLEPLCQEGRVAGVQTSEGALRARFVVDATGTARWLARQLNLAVSRASPCLRARYGYAGGECAERDEAPLWEGTPNGWTWTARIRSGLYHWTRLWFEAGEERSVPRDWQPEAFRALTPHPGTKGVDVTWRSADLPAGSGYFLAGDAAFLLDPAASHGVLKAIMSGMMTAHAICQITRTELTEADAQHAYRLWLSDWFAADAAKLSALYASLRG